MKDYVEVPVLTEEADIVVREGTVEDLPTIMRHRRGMFSDIAPYKKTTLDAMEVTSTPFITVGLEEGSYRAWLAETKGSVVAGGGLVIVGHPSAPHDPNPRRAWILNMYTEPEYRHRGFAKTVVQTIIDWCRSQGLASVSLHASDADRHLYEVLGFIPTNEMRLVLK
jgi:GNAT superfamily N-acetyltransferase